MSSLYCQLSYYDSIMPFPTENNRCSFLHSAPPSYIVFPHGNIGSVDKIFSTNVITALNMQHQVLLSLAVYVLKPEIVVN